jgi:HlyD family secretion protein
LVIEKQIINKGDVLATMESLANPKSVVNMSQQVESIYNLLVQNQTNEILKFYPNSNSLNLYNDLGELQPFYQTYIQSFTTLKDYLNKGFYLRKRAMLQTDQANIIKLHDILIAQKKLLEQDLSLSNENYKANENLIKEKVISQVDFRNEQSKLIAKQLSLPQLNASLVTNESQQNEKQKEIADLENQIIVQKNNFLQALLSFKSQIENWQFKYLLKAPVDGTVSFTGFFQENQEIKNGKSLFNVQPPNTSYFVEMLIPQYNFGKVKQGQEVLLKFQAYPFEQYGAVMGKIEYINQTPTDSGYLAKVTMPKGFVTNYNKPLQFHNSLYANAEIITENMRLLQRFYNSLTKQIHSR